MLLYQAYISLTFSKQEVLELAVNILVTLFIETFLFYKSYQKNIFISSTTPLRKNLNLHKLSDKLLFIST